MNSDNSKDSITIGGGCFWCLEAIFQRVKGVEGAKSGYSAGHIDNPTYKQVCAGDTGHAEVVQVDYNPKEVSCEELLQIFMRTHDPTTLNKQGNDHGTQYRSIILYKDEDQKQVAEKVIKDITNEKIYSDKIVTEIKPLGKFYPAEKYHDNYYNDNPNEGYCAYVVKPKLDKFYKLFKEKAKSTK